MTEAVRRPAPGLIVRQKAAERLAGFLEGAPFAPITEEEVADPRDRAFANRLATTAIRRHGQITAVLDDALDKGLPKDAGQFEAALRIGLTQLLFFAERGDHSAIHLAVEAIKADPKANRYSKLANGVLRGVQRRRDGLLMPETGLLPEWLAGRWRKTYGSMAMPALHQALVDGPALDLTVKPEATDTVAGFGGVKVLADTWRVARPPAPVAELPGYAQGGWWVQDAAAAIPARLLRVRHGHTVADLCAAPGGKTAQLAMAGGAVTAVDSDAERLALLAGNMDRLGLTGTVRVETGDAAEWGEAGAYDRVLLDAPCTATGILRRHPEVVWHRTQADIDNRAVLQWALLDNAARLVAPGGVLVYCVCSLEPEEGEAQAEAFLKRHAGFVPVPVEAEELAGWRAPITARGHLRTVPGMPVPGGAKGTLDGFFAARFLRTG